MTGAGLTQKRSQRAPLAGGTTTSSVLWRTDEDQEEGEVALHGRGEHHWTVRIKDGGGWSWHQHHGYLRLDDVLGHLPGLPSSRVRVWLPSPEHGTILVVDDTRTKPNTLAMWCPFTDPRSAALHKAAHEHDQGLSRSDLHHKIAAQALGATIPSCWQARDVSYYLSRARYGVALAALELGRSAQLPVELAGMLLTKEGVDTLSDESLEVLAGIAKGWSRSLKDLIEASGLLVR